MQKLRLLNVVLLWVGVLFVQDGRAQGTNPFNLPEGAIARLDKGALGRGDRAVAYSPNGTRLAVASSLGIWLYDAHTGAETALLFTEDMFWPHSVSFSPDGTILASGDWDNDVRLWDVASGQLKNTLQGHTGEVRSVSFSPDGTTLASAGLDTTIRLWDVASGQLKNTLENTRAGFGHSYVYSVSFSPDGTTLASGSDNHTVQLWDVASGQLKNTLQGHTSGVLSVSFSPDGTTLASASEEEVLLWDVASGQLKRTLEHPSWGLRSVSFSPDGTTLATAFREEILLWDVASGQLKNTLEHPAWGSPYHAQSEFLLAVVNSVAFSPDGTTLASTSLDATVRLWDVATGQLKSTLQEYTGSIELVSFSPDGATLAIASEDHAVRLWDAATGQLKSTLKGHKSYVNSMSFSSDGSILASASWDGTVRLWNVASGQLKNTIDYEEHRFSRSVSFSPDGTTLATGRRLWDVASGQLKRVLDHPSWGFRSVLFSPDGKTLATANKEEILLWDVDSGQLKNTLEGHRFQIHSVLFSPDGKTLATTSGGYWNWDWYWSWNRYSDLDLESGDYTIRLWDVDTGQLKSTLEHRSYVYSILFSPDGATLVTASYETIRLWDVASGQLKSSLEHESVHSVLFSPDGSILFSAGFDHAVRLWDVASGQLKNTLERGYPASFSPDGTTLVSRGAGTILLWDMTPYITLPTAVQSPSAPRPAQTALLANYPNPFNPETWIPFQLHAPAQVQLSIYDIRGALIRHIDLGHRAAGQYLTSANAAYWDGRDQHGARVASGVYFYQLRAGTFAQARKMLFLK